MSKDCPTKLSYPISSGEFEYVVPSTVSPSGKSLSILPSRNPAWASVEQEMMKVLRRSPEWGSKPAKAETPLFVAVTGKEWTRVHTTYTKQERASIHSGAMKERAPEFGLTLSAIFYRSPLRGWKEEGCVQFDLFCVSTTRSLSGFSYFSINDEFALDPDDIPEVVWVESNCKRCPEKMGSGNSPRNVQISPREISPRKGGETSPRKVETSPRKAETSPRKVETSPRGEPSLRLDLSAPSDSAPAIPSRGQRSPRSKFAPTAPAPSDSYECPEQYREAMDSVFDELLDEADPGKDEQRKWKEVQRKDGVRVFQRSNYGGFHSLPFVQRKRCRKQRSLRNCPSPEQARRESRVGSIVQMWKGHRRH